MTEESHVRPPVDLDVPHEHPVDSGTAFHREMLQAGLAQMDQSAKLINQYTAERKRSIPEPAFRNELLPILRAWIRGDNNAQPGLWFNVADGLTNEIVVTDSSGDTLFVAPPLSLETPTRAERVEGGGRFGTLHHLVSIQGVSIDNGDLRTAHNLDSTLVSICTPQAEIDDKAMYLIQLAAIYEYYELPMNELLGPEADLIVANLKESDRWLYIGGKQTSSGTTSPVQGVANGEEITDDEFSDF